MLFCACGSVDAEYVELKNDELRLLGIVIDWISSASTFSRWQEGRRLGIPNLDFLQILLGQADKKANSEAEAIPLLLRQDQNCTQPTQTWLQMQDEEIENIFWERLEARTKSVSCLIVKRTR
jgi:hypothetical protein